MLVHVLESDWSYSINGRKKLEKITTSLLRGRNPLEDLYNKREQITLDRYLYCKLLVPSGFKVVGESIPRKRSHLDNKGRVHEVEDCGYLIGERLH